MAKRVWDMSPLEQALYRARLRREARQTKGSYKGSPWEQMVSTAKSGQSEANPKRIKHSENYSRIMNSNPSYRPTGQAKRKGYKTWSKT